MARGKYVLELGNNIIAPDGLQGAWITTSWKQNEGTTIDIKHDNANNIPKEQLHQFIMDLDKAIFHLGSAFHPIIIEVGKSGNCHLIMFTGSNGVGHACDVVLRHSTERYEKNAKGIK